MRHNLVDQLPSLLLGFLSLISNDTLRYTLLAVTVCLTLLYVVHLERPSAQLDQLEDMIKETEDIIQEAKLYCARDLLSLAEKGVRLLEVKRSVSMIQCRILEAATLTWNKYRVLSGDIAECAKIIKNIQTAVHLIVEAERQRKLTEDINETETILIGVRSPSSEACPFINPMFICTSIPTFHLGKVSWYYTWSMYSVDTELEFVPMLWGQKDVAQWSDAFNGINATIVQRKPTALLGMNEACASAAPRPPSGKTWLQDFLIACNGGCTVDFIALHYYNLNATDFAEYLTNFHDNFQRPI
ncbi:hypothetical protein C8R44DRAFT_867083 [Mycena epipterygia]|nr:hypothetical protein C8R44DRAFT_867083 [Mycena epipterygia]